MKLVRKINQVSISANLKTRILLQSMLPKTQPNLGSALMNVIIIEEVQKYEGIQLDGLMTIASYCPDDLKLLPFFYEIKKSKSGPSNRFGIPLNELSMGMSGDMREAILSGSTMIRVGSSLFGSRSA